jgi:hypothetical protein
MRSRGRPGWPLPVPRQQIGCIAAFVLGLAMIPAAPVSASQASAGPFTYVSKKSTVASNDFSGDVAFCPLGTRLSGGGGSVAPAGEGRFVSSLFPVDSADADADPDEAYVAQVTNESQGTAGYETDAICLRRSPGDLSYARDSHVTSTPGFIAAGQSVYCASGRRPVGGGADLLGSGLEEQLNVSHPRDPDDPNSAGYGWFMYALKGGGTAEFAAYSICVPEGEWKIRYRTQGAKVEPGKKATLTARCPRKLHVSGGGVASTMVELVTASTPEDSGRDADKAADDAWRARVYNYFDHPESATAYAVCVK